MSKALSTLIQDQINNKYVKTKYVLTIGGKDASDYIINFSLSFSKEFGSAQCTLELDNSDYRFTDGGSAEILVGDIVDFDCYYEIDTNQRFDKFYGFVNQRSITKTATNRSISIICLDYISILQFMDIDLEIEGDKILVENETLTPTYLSSPNDSLAQIFNFANNSLADNPLPSIKIVSKDTNEEDPQFDGFSIIYSEGQLKLGFPLNAKNNYDLVASKYWFYTKGIYAEDVIKEILIQPDGYSKYLFNETTEQALIDNHLTETYQNVEGAVPDYLIPNYTDSEITIETTLTSGIPAGATSINVNDTSGFSIIGTGSINGDAFTWSGRTATTLTGIPSSGTNSLNAHISGSYVKYTATYLPGQVWYLRYSNLISILTTADFTIPGGNFNYLDLRNGRIILVSPVSTSAIVKCNANYSFYTLQATGVEINKISFRSREVENRFDAIKKIREYLAPNYVIYTRGDKKIWSKYLSQRTTADFTLSLATSLQYMEDEDLYTRVIFYGKNINPTNLLLAGNVALASTGETYVADAVNSSLSLLREEGNYYVYGSPISGIGQITTNIIKPKVYIDGVLIDNTAHRIVGQQVVVEVTTRTETNVSVEDGGCF